jgi:DNA-binding MarR family transcriptional regulator
MRKNEQMDQREELTQQVLEQHSRLFICLRLPQTHDLMLVDLTMQQFKTVVLLGALGSATAGQLARGLGVSLSTMTGIVDRLCERGMVTRGEDPEDRRATRVALTDTGRETVERFQAVKRELMTRLLSRLSLDQLQHAAATITALADAAADLALEPGEAEVAGFR